VVHVKVNREKLSPLAKRCLGNPHLGLPDKVDALAKWLGQHFPPWQFRAWDPTPESKQITVLEILLFHEKAAQGAGNQVFHKLRLKATVQLFRAGVAPPGIRPELELYPPEEFQFDVTNYRSGALFDRIFGEERFKKQFRLRVEDYKKLLLKVPVCSEVKEYLANGTEAVLPLDHQSLKDWLRSCYRLQLTAEPGRPLVFVKARGNTQPVKGWLRVNCLSVQTNGTPIPAARFPNLADYCRGEIYLDRFVDTFLMNPNIAIVGGQGGDPCE
ncbi:MAG TPA: hypothetical protein VEL76_37650, partial [Gemmataceae bacterium]|nr:hypothetical protein [Gemmataceae bacterium]